MKGYRQKPNWLLVAIFAISYQLITYQYIVPISKGLPIGGLTTEMMAAESWLIPLVILITMVLAYFTAIVCQGYFFSKGVNTGRAMR